VARRRSPTEQRGWPAIPNGRAGQTDTRTGAQQRVDRRPTEGDRCPTESGSGPTEGGVSGGGPTGDYISAASPLFWALSSCAQSHLQEIRECKVLMSESGPLRGEFRKECFLPQCFYD
jgi:hypothetical protein